MKKVNNPKRKQERKKKLWRIALVVHGIVVLDESFLIVFVMLVVISTDQVLFGDGADSFR